MASQKKAVLAIGVRGLANWTPQESQKLISTEIEKGTTAGLELELHQVNLQDSEEQTLKELEQSLLKRNWEAIAFGYGLRGDRDRTPLFEKIVNVAVQRVPNAKIAFPILPDKIVEAFERVLHP